MEVLIPMKISEALLPEFEQESGMTRSVLERCPEAKFSFKPHAKSWELIKLASHLANLPSWLVLTLKQESFDVMPVGGEPYKEDVPPSTDKLLAVFDKNTNDAKAAIAETSDEDYMKIWSLLKGGQTLFSMPRVVCVRSFCLNHSIFHRGQLAVYLRLIDVPVPALYGPSADEGSF
jgi:uncharacterized damage-inducible protein DinB